MSLFKRINLSWLNSYSAMVSKMNEVENVVKYRVISFDEVSGLLKIQIVGKSLFIKEKLNNVLADKVMLFGFSKIDIERLHSVQASKDMPFKSSVKVEHTYCSETQQLQVKCTYPDGSTEIKSCQEVLRDRHLISQLDDVEKVNIGYRVGFASCQDKRAAL